MVAPDHLAGGRLILGVGTGDPNDPTLAAVGGEGDARQRVALVDEGLDVLVGLWSGEPFSYASAHHHVRDLTFLPRPLQAPRIPIWIGGRPNPGPTRRAARWDGSCLSTLPEVGNWEDCSPADIRALRADIARRRTATAPFEFVIGGRRRGPDWEAERAQIAALAEAGTTWWIEYLPVEFGDLAAIRERIGGGPLRPIA